MIVGGKCQGCSSRLDYVLAVDDIGDMPSLYPQGGGVAYRGGHLCGPCARAVERFFADRRLHPAASEPVKCLCCGGINQGNTCCPSGVIS